MSTLEDFDRILAELAPPGGASPASNGTSAPVSSNTSTTVSVTATAPAARSTAQPPRPSVAVEPSPARPAATTTATSTATAPSNASKIAELESMLLDLGPSRPTAPSSTGGSSFSASSTTTSTPSRAPAAGNNSTTTSSFSSTTNSSGSAPPRAPAAGGGLERTRTASVSVSKPPPAASSDAITCGRCFGQITGTYIAALDKNWHPEHFTCSSCSKSLNGNFFETDKGILCSECASEQIRCSECQKPITGTHLIYSDGRPVHNECVPKSSCGRCHNLLSLGDAHVEALDKLWHPECFACTRCMTPLGSTFVQYEGTPYCQPCIQILSKERNIVFKT